MGFSHLVTVLFVNVEGEQEVCVVVVNMVVVSFCFLTLAVVVVTVVVNVHDCFPLIDSAVILWNTVVLEAHILVGLVFITGVSLSGIEHGGAVWS